MEEDRDLRDVVLDTLAGAQDNLAHMEGKRDSLGEGGMCQEERLD